MDKTYLKYNVLDNGKKVIDLVITLYKKPETEISSDTCTVLINHSEDIYISDDYEFNTTQEITQEQIYLKVLWNMLDINIYDIMKHYGFRMEDFYNEDLASEILLIFTHRIKNVVQNYIFERFKVENIELLYGELSEKGNPLHIIKNSEDIYISDDFVGAGASIFK